MSAKRRGALGEMRTAADRGGVNDLVDVRQLVLFYLSSMQQGRHLGARGHMPPWFLEGTISTRKVVINRNFQAAASLIFGRNKFSWEKWLEIWVFFAIVEENRNCRLKTRNFGEWLKKVIRNLGMKVENFFQENQHEIQILLVGNFGFLEHPPWK